MERLLVSGENSNYPVYIDNSLSNFFMAFKECIKPKTKVFLITDSKVSILYKNVVDLFEDMYHCKVFIITEGEQQKNMETVNSIYEFLIENNCDRCSVLIGLGGGVVGDLTGFAAATFMRGIKFINIPTTLTAQVDSSIGGKVGYNYNSIKNIIGCFYNPVFVFVSTHFLKTLEKDIMIDGICEVIKYGLISSNHLLGYIEKNYKGILEAREAEILYIINNCIGIKVSTITEDFKDLGLRNILNFGHTVGHAIEINSRFSIHHGEAVALGMLTAIKLSEHYFGLNNKVFERVINLYKKLGIQNNYKVDNYKSFLYAIKHDKKNNNAINFVLLEEIGKPRIKVKVKLDDIIWAIKSSIDTEEK